MSLPGVIATLHRAGVHPTARELAEAIWLAGHLTPPSRPAGTPAGVSPVPRTGDEHPGQGRGEGRASEPDAVEVAASVPGTAATAVPGFPVRSPGPSAPFREKDVERALRPLRDTVPSRRSYVVDEAATAAHIAATKVWTPVVVPARERALDVVLAVDESPSMRLWENAGGSLAATLIRTGAFRDVRVCRIVRQAGDPLLLLGRATRPRSPRQFVDGTGRRVFLVLTDGADRSWHDGSAARLIADWARSGPTAVVQPLPEQMWPRTGLPAVAAVVTSGSPAPPNTRLAIAYRRRRRVPGVPLLVLGLEHHALSSWARLISKPPATVSLAVTTIVDGAVPRAEVADTGTALQRFRATSSPEAFQLAVWLSVVPLTLPVMRLVQHVATPGGRPSVLAEIVLSGILRRTGDESFEFAGDVRERLLDHLRRSEAATVLEAVNAFIVRNAGRAGAWFPALAVHPDGDVVTGAETFGWVPAAAATRLGLRTAAPQPAPTATTRPATALPREAPEPPFADDLSAPVFYLSYYRPDPVTEGAPREVNRFVLRFFDDLTEDVNNLLGSTPGRDLGFLDVTRGGGERWTRRVLRAVGTCQVFVPLLSPPYLTGSSWCAREWDLFAQRRVVRHGPGPDPAGSAIVPVLWSPIARPVPRTVAEVTLFLPTHLRDDFQANYQAEGLLGLLRTGQENVYQAVVWRLAQHIARTYHSYHVEPLTVDSAGSLRSTFA